MLDVSVIVCTKNAEGTLEQCLESVWANNPREVIVVDGLSTDRTRDVVAWFDPYDGKNLQYTRLLSDEGKGLAHARNVGLDAAKGKYICYVGPDNVLDREWLFNLVMTKELTKWSGVSAPTRTDCKGWLSRQMHRYKKMRYTPGKRSIIGTPHLWEREVLAQYRFDDKLTSSDDADLCERMAKDGHTLGITVFPVTEIGTTTLADIRRRWLWYGNSDHEFWRKYSSGWTWRRKVKSLLHPLTAELIGPVRKDLRLAAFCLMITGLRYWGWIRSARHGI